MKTFKDSITNFHNKKVPKGKITYMFINNSVRFYY